MISCSQQSNITNNNLATNTKLLAKELAEMGTCVLAQNIDNF